MQGVTGSGQYEDPVEEYLDQIDELTHKLSVAESKLKSLQSDRKSASNLNCVTLFSIIFTVLLIYASAVYAKLAYILWKAVGLLKTTLTKAGTYH